MRSANVLLRLSPRCLAGYDRTARLSYRKKDVDQATSAMVQATEDYKIQVLENESDIEQKQNTFELAKIDLKKYEKQGNPFSLFQAFTIDGDVS